MFLDTQPSIFFIQSVFFPPKHFSETCSKIGDPLGITADKLRYRYLESLLEKWIGVAQSQFETFSPRRLARKSIFFRKKFFRELFRRISSFLLFLSKKFRISRQSPRWKCLELTLGPSELSECARSTKGIQEAQDCENPANRGALCTTYTPDCGELSTEPNPVPTTQVTKCTEYKDSTEGMYVTESQCKDAFATHCDAGWCRVTGSAPTPDGEEPSYSCEKDTVTYPQQGNTQSSKHNYMSQK